MSGKAAKILLTEKPPLSGWREARVSTQKTKQAWAREVADLLDRCYPTAEKITLVLDNLNTHTIGSLYATFAPEKARRYADRLDLRLKSAHSLLRAKPLATASSSLACPRRRPLS